jgi:beta-N-acetylhexosaminidase
MQSKHIIIITPQGPVLSDQEKDLYSKYKPYGFILYGKHCINPEQVKQLCADLRACAGNDCVISIDQEGGRVSRMRSPHWPEFPAAADMTDPYQTYFDLGTMIKAEGVNVNYAPCLDVIPTGQKSDAIGDRCFSPNPNLCGEKGIDACRGMIDAGITPVIKHMPGHGRAVEDTHYFLPVVKASETELQDDLKPFQAVAQSGLDIAGMTCHVLFEAWDKDHPATLSKKIINDIIRGEIGFKGLLYSDDLAMKALDRYGDIVKRVQLSFEAGCDIACPCNTTFEETKRILEASY